MSIRIASTRDHKKVTEAIQEASQPGGRPYKLRMGLFVGGQDYTPELRNAEWGQDEIPITLDAELSGYLAPAMTSKKAELYVEVEDVLIPQVPGVKTACRSGETAWTTNLISSSAGALLNADDAVKMGAYQEYPIMPPDQVAWDVLRRLPYDKNQVFIQNLPGVLVDFRGTGNEPGFLAEEKTGDVLSRLAAFSGVGYDYRDTVMRGFVAELPTVLSRVETEAKTYHARDLPDWSFNRPASPEVMYHSVRCFCTSSDGELVWEVSEEVPYTGDVEIPHQNRTLDVPFNDASPNGPANGRAHAARLALDLARLRSTGEMLLPSYDPLYERGDRYRVHEDLKTKTGHLEILWAMRTEGYRHGYGADLGSGGNTDMGLMATQIRYSATVLEENAVKPPALIVPGRSGNVLPASPTPLWGDGPPDELYFSDGLDWVASDPSDPNALVFYDTGAARVDPQNPDQLVIDDGDPTP